MEIKTVGGISLFLLVIAFGVSSCVQSDQVAPTATEQPVIAVETPVPTHTRQPGTVTPTATITNTVTPTPTHTLEPGLGYDEAVESILNLLATNGDCTLPCWIGFTPGVSTRDDVDDFIRDYQELIEVTRSYDNGNNSIYFNPLPNGVLLDLDFVLEENLVSTINLCMGMTAPVDGGYRMTYDDPVFFEVTEAYSLASILNQFGKPTDMLFTARIPGAERWPSFTQLYYQGKGIVAEYISAGYGTVIEAGVDTGQQITNPADGHMCFVLLPEDAVLSSEYLNEQFLASYGKPAEYMPFEDVTNMTIDTFYETYLTPRVQEYIFTDASLWPY